MWYFLLSIFVFLGVGFAQEISVESFDEQLNNENQETLRLRLVNNTSDTLENIRLQYFVYKNPSKTLQVNPYFISNANLSLDTLDEQIAVNIDIEKIAPGIFPNSSGISIGLNYTDWSKFEKAKGLSYQKSNAFVVNNKVAVYKNGILIYGNTIVKNNFEFPVEYEKPQPYIEHSTIYVDEKAPLKPIRFAWHRAKNAERYLLTVKNQNDSIVYTGIETDVYADLDLPENFYLWSVQNLNSSGTNDNEEWFSIKRIAADFSNANVLNVPAFGVRKDTRMLVPNWGEKIFEMPWDKPNETGLRTLEEDFRCWVVGVQMLNAYYGGNLTQDEIKYYGKTASFTNLKFGNYLLSRDVEDLIITPFALSASGGGYGFESKIALKWALNIEEEHLIGNSKLFKFDEDINFTADTIKKYIDMQRPIYISNEKHVMIIDGYNYNDPNNKIIHFLNLFNGGETGWLSFNSQHYISYWVPFVNNNVRKTDYRIHIDSDGDGIVDFDEIERFKTNPYNIDSDDDRIDDKTEIVSYTQKEPLTILVGDTNNIYVGDLELWPYNSNSKQWYFKYNLLRQEQFADIDKDGKRAELDVDSDNANNDGAWDGDEDKNKNGKVDNGETDPYNAADDALQSQPAVVLTDWDAPNDITLYALDRMYVNDRTVCYDGNGFCKIASESGRIEFAINVGVESIVGDIQSKGGVWLRSGATVNGNISFYSLPVNDLETKLQQSSVFNGIEKFYNFSAWPYKVWDGNRYKIQISSNVGDLTVTAGAQQVLKDGDAYNNVKVEAGGTLLIYPGVMHVKNIQLEAESSIIFVRPGEQTVIWSDGNLIWRSTLLNDNKAQVARGFKLIQLSSNRMFIEGDWAGTIHVARASLVMGQTNKEMYGRFVANTLVIHQNSKIYRVDFSPIQTEFVFK